MKNRPQMKKYTSGRDIDNELIETMGHSLSFLAMGVIEAKFDDFEGKFKKIENMYYFIQEQKEKYHIADDVSPILLEAKVTRPYIYESCKQVPFSQLLRLAEVNTSKGRSTANPNLKAYLQAGYCIVGVWMDNVLKEHYRFSEEKRKKYFEYLNDWIDSYQKGYLSNDGIREQYIEDLGYDLVKGEKVI